jgi:hypothetical protein
MPRRYMTRRYMPLRYMTPDMTRPYMTLRYMTRRYMTPRYTLDYTVSPVFAPPVSHPLRVSHPHPPCMVGAYCIRPVPHHTPHIAYAPYLIRPVSHTPLRYASTIRPISHTPQPYIPLCSCEESERSEVVIGFLLKKHKKHIFQKEPTIASPSSLSSLRSLRRAGSLPTSAMRICVKVAHAKPEPGCESRFCKGSCLLVPRH